MKVSVIVPVRDEEDSIRELLDSLLAQTRPPDEIVITDGGSVDATPQIIEDYIHKRRARETHSRGRRFPGAGATSPPPRRSLNGWRLPTAAFVWRKTGSKRSSRKPAKMSRSTSFTAPSNR